MNIFKKKSIRKIYFHEDDYCQQQFLPLENQEWVNNELKNIGEFSDKHKSESGFGWNEIYVGKDPTISLADMKLTLEEVSIALAQIMPVYDVVFTGYSTYREKCERTSAWGLNPYCAIFLNWDEKQIVKNVWTNFFDIKNDSIIKSASVAEALGKLRSLLYVDWAWGYSSTLDDPEEFAEQLRAKLKSLREV
jgi:hypothetical protein